MNLVKIENGQAVVSSRQIAENFGKRHAHVIDAVEKHIKDLHSAEKSVQWFYESSYQDSTGRSCKEYLMNRDGFSLLVMSFNNTRDVLDWKLKYIQAFNEMEQQLHKQIAPELSLQLQVLINMELAQKRNRQNKLPQLKMKCRASVK